MAPQPETSQDFLLESGAKLHVSIASFQDALALNTSLARAMKGVKIDPEFLDKDVTEMKDMMISLATSPEVQTALFVCMGRATYNSERVVPKLFDDRPDARQDFFEICWKVIDVNCRPFFLRLLSKFKESAAKTSDIQKQP